MVYFHTGFGGYLRGRALQGRGNGGVGADADFGGDATARGRQGRMAARDPADGRGGDGDYYADDHHYSGPEER